MIRLSRLAITRHGGARRVRLAFPDLDLPQGGLLALRGASGSGKSTLIALLAGLLAPDEGSLVVCGTDPASLAPAQRDAWRGRTLGLLPQRLHLLPALSVRENLLLAGLAVGAPAAASRERAETLLARFELSALAGSRPAQLSGGQAQRVALARALMNHPQLLIADEPTASLDDDSAALAVGQLLLARRDTGASLLVSTHDARTLEMLRDAPGECRVLDLGRAAGAP